jgi:hypothetical protein
MNYINDYLNKFVHLHTDQVNHEDHVLVNIGDTSSHSPSPSPLQSPSSQGTLIRSNTPLSLPYLTDIENFDKRKLKRKAAINEYMLKLYIKYAEEAAKAARKDEREKLINMFMYGFLIGYIGVTVIYALIKN